MQILKSQIKIFVKTKFINTLPLILISSLFKNIKLNFIIGSFNSFLSADQIICSPFAYKNFFFVICYWLVKIFTQIKPFNPLLIYHVPTLLQLIYISLCFSNNNFVKKFYVSKIFLSIICSLCIILFICHPVGRLAIPYTIFWVIPIIASIFKHKNFFLHALSGTLLAHGVGSVIWIYFKNPLTPAIWIGLIPVVFVERLLIASGATIIHEIINIRLPKFLNIFRMYFNQLKIKKESTNICQSN